MTKKNALATANNIGLMKNFLKEFAPFIGVGFAAGVAVGVLINIWCLTTVMP